MNTANIYKKLEAVDFSVIDEIATLNPEEAFILINKGLIHQNADVRELSLLALERRPEDKAVDLLLKLLVDDDMSVQMAAIGAIAKRPSKGIVPGLKQALSEVDPDMQAEIILALGMCGDASQKEFMQGLLKKAEKDEESELVHNLNMALARLGDLAAQNSFVINLNSNQIEERRDALYDLEYINDPRLLAKSKELLNDTEDATDIGKNPPHVYIRICDLFVMITNRVLGHPFSFAERGRQFTEEERRIVELYLKQHYEKSTFNI